ncbi:MAG: M1 family metallopeptidase [Planctomycetes bacterium]|nr:M1 family metallopeptidase [Planctomycetota bacterium]
MNRLLLACSLLLLTPAWGQSPNGDALFRQLEDELPTPTSTRAASGAPGHDYWQQRVDYAIEASLDESTHEIRGKERIAYTNHSPDTLRYLWVQLDQNLEAPDAEALRIRTTDPVGKEAKKSYQELGFELMREAFPGGHTIEAVTDGAGQALAHRITGTMLRIDLPQLLAPGATQRLAIAWRYTVRDISTYYSRTGYERIKGDEQNAIYTIAHWYPRLAAYSDRYGWHVHHYVGEEFALEFGDFEVQLTVPADFVVAATGELQNADVVLTPTQRERLAAARTAEAPVFVVTPDEAKAAQASKAEGTKTWAFAARNVRDFAWAASRKYIWDAWGVKVGERTVMAMSAYPNEAEPLWSHYSTHAVAHTLEHYGRYLPYPYPVAWSCNGAVGGMEHPMVSFQSERPEPDGTYSAGQKYGLISVIVHEVGHNWFPMIVNNDERRWRWMDEGFNSFLQQVAEGYWEQDYPSRNDFRRERILGYMAKADDQPIMTNTSLLIEGGNNAYAKTTLALTVLREAVLGREVFDQAFSEYCHRWAFKRPMPADFFRTMEDAAGVDLDWFFRAWFYGTDHVDLAVTGVRELTLLTREPEVDKPRAKARAEAARQNGRLARNAKQPKRVDRHPGLRDYYNDYDEHAVTAADRKAYAELVEKLEPYERELLRLGRRIYVVDFENVGGVPMPLPLTFHFVDGTRETLQVPATVWRRSIGGKVSKLFLFERELARVVVDAEDVQADVNPENNAFPPAIRSGTLELTKEEEQPNPMQLEKQAAEEAAKQAEAPPEKE